MLIPLDPPPNVLLMNLSAVESTMLGLINHAIVDHGFWSRSSAEEELMDERWPIRILVCGGVGVGKSTLIDRVFGVSLVSPKTEE